MSIREVNFDSAPLNGVLASLAGSDLTARQPLPPLVQAETAEAEFAVVIDHTSFITFKGQFPLAAITVKGVELTPHAATTLGPYNVERLTAFAQLESGWGEGQGRRLQPESIAALVRFLAVYDEFCGTEPSLFLNYDGLLELGWEDPDGSTIEVILGDGEYGVFLEATGEESWVSEGNLPHLVERIRGQCQ